MGEGLKVGKFVFDGFPDVYAWVQTHLKEDDYAFGAFLDALTACQHMVDNDTTVDSLATKLKNAGGAGIKSFHEACALTSLRNGLPTVFAGSGSSSTSQHPLPKIDKPSKWDDKLYEGGLKFTLRDFMTNTLTTIMSSMIDDLTSVEARLLALEMLHATQRFWHGYVDNLSLTYEYLLTAGLKELEAWNFATSEGKRILVDLNKPRASAVNIGAQIKERRAYTCAQVLFAMLKSHKVMKDYLDEEFKSHPSVVAERTKLLFNNMSFKDKSGKSGEDSKALTAAKNAQGAADKVGRELSEVKKLLDKKADK